MKKYIPIALALSMSLIYNLPSYCQYEYNSDADYSKYYDSGISYYNKSEYSKAIEQFSQALKLAPKNSAIRNNLAVSYISRGIYFHNSAKDYNEAINNYREAIYYLKYDASEGSVESQNASGNLGIAIKNLANAMQGIGQSIDNISYHFKTGKDLRAKGQFRQAIVEYWLALDKSPANAEALESIGDMYRVLQNNDRAASAYDKAISINNKNPQLLIKAGMAYEKIDKVDDAIKAYNQASILEPSNKDALTALQKIWEEQIKINPRNAAAHANLGAVLQKSGQYDAALAQYNAAEFIDPNNITIRLNLGTLYQAKGDINTAMRAYDTILQVDPKNVLARYYKSTALKQSKDYEAAKKELNTILQIDPNNAIAKKELLNIAKETAGSGTNIYQFLKEAADREPNNAKAQYDAGFEAHSNGNITDAIAYYKKAIRLDPKMTDAYSNLGAALISIKEYNEALTVLNKAQQLDPTNDKIQKLISDISETQKGSSYDEALALHQQGKVKEAIEIYKKAIQEDPNNPEVYINLGAAYQSLKNYDLAIQQYRKAISLDPNSSLAYFYLGTTLHAKNSINDAISNYKKALTIDPNNKQVKDSLKAAEDAKVQILLSEGLNAYSKKSIDEAKSIFEQALKLNPNNALGYYYLGLIMEDKNNTGLAITYYQKAIQNDNKLDSAYYALGVALDKNNDRAGAKNAFSKYVQLAGSRNDAFVKYAKERLKQL